MNMKNEWSSLEAFEREHPNHWWKVLRGSAVALPDGREGRIDAVYRDDERQLVKVRVRLADGKSETICASSWAGIGDLIPFPAEADLENIAAAIDEEAPRLLTGIGSLADMARALEKTYAETADHGKLIKASSLWRRANRPEDALRVTAGYDELRGDTRAAMLTTRGGALADLGRADEALSCADEAVRCATRERPHPFMLLVRVHTLLGNAAGLDEALTRAKELGGGSGGAPRSTLLQELKRLKPEERDRLVRELQKLNPGLYKFLFPSSPD